MNLKLKRTPGGMYAVFDDGLLYELVEGIVPGSGRSGKVVTSDVLFVVDEDGTVLDWIYGFTFMRDDEIAEFCKTVRRNQKTDGTVVEDCELVYTGGGVWCIFGKLKSGKYFAGECDFNSLDLYKTREAADECMGEGTDGFICHLDAEHPLFKKIWREVYAREIEHHKSFSDYAVKMLAEFEKTYGA